MPLICQNQAPPIKIRLNYLESQLQNHCSRKKSGDSDFAFYLPPTRSMRGFFLDARIYVSVARSRESIGSSLLILIYWAVALTAPLVWECD